MIQPNTQESNNATNGKFEDLGIAPKLLDILSREKFITPTPIQAQSIPAALSGSDLMGIAQTGTGKTLAFGIPMIQRLAQGSFDKTSGKGIGLVVLPTRELALQVNETLKKIGTPIGLKTAILIGGEAIGRQLTALRRGPHIIIATPGRLIDHMEKKSVDLSKTAVLVLDEADRMLDMGFAPQLNKILERVPKNRQTLLFSATMPDAIVKIANSYMKTPLRIEVAPAGSAVKSVTQEIYFLERGEKLALLKQLLTKFSGSVLVFSRTKYGAKKIARDVRNMGINSSEIHSNRSLNQRLEALQGFKLGKYRVLVATDIAARGIDVTGIQLVVNYDLPDQAEDYVHRIGRTGRASMTGHAISFATHDQRRDVKTIERLIRITLPVATMPKLERVASVTPPRPPLSEGRSSGRNHGGRDSRGSRDSDRGRNDRRPATSGSRPMSSGSRPFSNSRPPSRGYEGSKPRPAGSGRTFTPRSTTGKPDNRKPYQGNKPSYRSGGSSSPSSGMNRRPARSHARPGDSASGGKRKKWSDYERGRKPAPASLKKISPSATGFFINKKAYSDDE
jgi:ATP-dependent RNA helicase RhlE